MTVLSTHTVCHFACDLIWRAVACGDIFLSVYSRTAWSIHAPLRCKIYHNSWLYFANFMYVACAAGLSVTYSLFLGSVYSVPGFPVTSAPFFSALAATLSQVGFLQPSHTINPFVLSCRDVWEFNFLSYIPSPVIHISDERQVTFPSHFVFDVYEFQSVSERSAVLFAAYTWWQWKFIA